MSATLRIVRVRMRKPVGPGIEDTTITDFYRLDPSTNEKAIAHGDNVVRKSKLAASGWIPSVTLATEAQFMEEAHCG